MVKEFGAARPIYSLTYHRIRPDEVDLIYLGPLLLQAGQNLIIISFDIW